MGANSKIEWTHHTFNPWWGCQRVSAGCENCYAETFAKRTGLALWGGEKSGRRFFGDKHWREPLKWDRDAAKAGERRRVFCASMADLFEARADLDPWRARVWDLVEATQNLDWLFLTKRADQLVQLAPARWAKGWPSNVWPGVSVENQATADERIPHSLACPAAVRWVSYEPALGPVDFSRIDAEATATPMCMVNALTGRQTDMGRPCPDVARLDWIVVGGESGPGARPFDLAWARETIAACRAAGVPVFVKQLGARPCELAEGEQGEGLFYLRQRDRKGGDMAEWPEDLRVRDYPQGARA